MDCNKTEVFFKELKRMCEKYNSTCVGCKIYSICFDTGCYGFIKNNPQKAIEIVQEWSDENSLKTRQSELLKLFPETYLVNGVINICPKDISRSIICVNPEISCDDCKKQYWLAEVK